MFLSNEVTMHHLLVAIDGSESAGRALQHAMALAREMGAVELHLATVLPEPIIYGEIAVYVSADKIHAMQQEHAAEILAPAIEAVKQAGVPYTTDVLIGEVAPSLVKKAAERGCDGIVMGTRGTGVIENLMMGSIATKVVHLTKLPVTLVH
jgi:nucleotide-binding universal stress UspA family protein